MMYLRLFIFAFLVTGCLSGDSIDNYADKLIRSGKPGTFCRVYLDQLNCSDTLQLLQMACAVINHRWIYENDQPGKDIPVRAEKVFRTQQFRGDCEDKAVVYMAIARELGFFCRLGLGKSTEIEGHAWTEIRLSQFKDNGNAENRFLEVAFPNGIIFKESGYLWLALISKPEYESLIPQYYIIPGNNEVR